MRQVRTEERPKRDFRTDHHYLSDEVFGDLKLAKLNPMP